MAFESSINEYLSHYESMNEELYHKEFISLKLQSQKNKEGNVYPAEAGQLPVNKKKNRFKDILPFEYTRVSLHPTEGVEGSDYINANYITGVGDDVTYIAAQGPLPNTVCDFWRMLWYHSIEIVVMACREIENAKPKCECYWPDKNSTRDFAGISVTTIAEENKSNDFVVRDFLVKCGGEEQSIRQYHYTAWPDHGKPSSSEPVIKMLEMVHDHRRTNNIPLLFHCSAGCGRTGTMIAIDIARTMFIGKSLSESFSIHNLVERMRTQRPSMVQAKDQYHFVHDVVAELARRALGFNPTLPAKPQPSNMVVSETSDGVYENAASYNSLPSSTSPETPSSEPEDSTKADTPTPHKLGVSPAPSPHTRRPVARQRSNPIKSSKDPHDPKYENVPSASEPPVPPIKPSSIAPVPSPKPRTRGLKSKDPPPARSPKPVRAEHSPPAKKQPPPPPPHKPQKSPPTPPRTSTPVKPKEEIRPLSSHSNDGAYSVVDMSQITDTGPSIAVVNERNGRRTPLATIEDQMEKTGQMDVSKSSSIMDTLLSLVGDEVITEVEVREQEDTPPSPPPVIGRRTMSMMSDAEPPPDIPVRTEASYQLVVGAIPELAEGYDTIGAHVDDGFGGNMDYELVPAPIKVVKDVSVSVYEAPTPLSKRVSDSPPPLPADRPRKSPSMELLPRKSPSMEQLGVSNTITLPSAGPKSPRGTSTRSKLGKLFKSTLIRTEKKKVSTTDITGPVGAVGAVKTSGLARSPSDHGSSSSSSRPSPSHSTSSFLANARYNFPGELGYGIRICKPAGPRQEPNGWKVRTLTNSVA